MAGKHDDGTDTGKLLHQHKMTLVKKVQDAEKKLDAPTEEIDKLQVQIDKLRDEQNKIAQKRQKIEDESNLVALRNELALIARATGGRGLGDNVVS